MERGPIEGLMVHWRLVFAVLGVAVACGVVSLVTMPRQEFPDFTVRQGLVSPKATARATSRSSSR